MKEHESTTGPANVVLAPTLTDCGGRVSPNANRFAVRAFVMAITVITSVHCSLTEAAPSVALDVRAGTTGYGFDVDVGLLSRLNARVGYSTFSFDRKINQTDVTYDGKLKISDVSALLDWYAFGGGFHLTAGGVGGGGLTVDATGVPNAHGTYTINGQTYTGNEVGSLAGRLKFGNSLSPYVGLGWGNPVGAKHHLHVLFDIGAIYGGTPNVSLSATCGSAAPTGSPTCTQLQSDVQVERQRLQNDVTLVKWYPVLNLGLAYRF
jgi:hypothetical protein